MRFPSKSLQRCESPSLISRRTSQTCDRSSGQTSADSISEFSSSCSPSSPRSQPHSAPSSRHWPRSARSYPLDELDLQIRNFLYRRFVETGQAPRTGDAAAEFGLDGEEAEAAFRRLHDAHALVLERDALEIRMLNPFSCVPSAWRVEAGGRQWYSNCAWDSFAVCAALHSDGRIESSCADCGEPLAVDVRDQKPVQRDYLFHVLVPARQWWDDIVFT